MNNFEMQGVIFLIEYKGRFLLEQRDDNSKWSKWSWVFPGGKRDEGEKTLQTVTREAYEEFGFKLKPQDCKKVEVVPTHSGKGMNEVWYCLVDEIQRPIVISESAGAGWFTLDEIKGMELGYSQSELVVPVVSEML